MTPGDDMGRVTNLKTPVGGVERIVSPMKPPPKKITLKNPKNKRNIIAIESGLDTSSQSGPSKPKKINFRSIISSDSGYEPSSPTSPAGPSSQEEFLRCFVKLGLLFKKKPISIGAVNKSLRRLSMSPKIPKPSYINKNVNEKVSQSFS